MEITTRLLLLSRQSLPRAGLLFDIPNRYPFVDLVGKHDGPAQLRQFAEVASGTVTLYHPAITGSETIASSEGGAPVSVIVGGIVIGVGKKWSIKDSAGHHWSHCSALSQTSVVMWDVSGLGDHLVATGLAEAVVAALCSSGRDLTVGTDWLDRGITVAGELYQVARRANGSRLLPDNLIVPALEDGSACAGYNFMGEVAPENAILHYDAEISPLTELVGEVHTLNHAVLGPQYQRLADGSYVNVGAQPAVDVLASGIKGLRTCGAVTNLLPADTSIARAVTLTAQTYTLQVLGSGSASCSYGTATVGSPLTFTATAGTTTFTPSGATLWILTATAYPTPYVPPGVTQPGSNATATNGTWFALPDGSDLWKATDGAADGVELWAGTISLDSGWTNNGDGTFTGVNAIGDIYKSSIVAANSRAQFSYEIISRTAGSISPKLNGTVTTYVSTVGTYNTILADMTGFAKTGFSGNSFSGVIRVTSIKRIQPQPFTLATRILMGVGSADLANNTNGAVVNINTAGTTVYSRKSADGLITRAAVAHDGTTTIYKEVSVSWPHNAIIQTFLQVNTAGNRFRVGYMIEGTHTAIQWSHTGDSATWAVYDGSFNPSTLYRLMIGYDNPYPMWINKITAWKRTLSDSEILEAWA